MRETMIEAEAKGKALASGSNGEGEKTRDENKKVEDDDTDAEIVASELVKSNMEIPETVSGGEEKMVDNQKEEIENANDEIATPQHANLNVKMSTTVSGGEENKKEENEKALSTVGENSRKRKRKKVAKPKTKVPVKNANAKTAATDVVKLNVEGPASIAGGEGKKEENKNKENKEELNNNGNILTRGENSRKRKRKKVTTESANSVPSKGTDKPETSTKEKNAKRSDSMGMIFMCSSKTKQDCYRYKILGLPAAKKDMVTQIYKGMRLFLFDIDLKLLYGIYRAAEPGGYNIEPKAFKSAFPSQVRFSIMEDCLPLAEEKFKAVIKDNYYGKNKFDCQLKAEQVKNLCKLFRATAKGRESEHVGRVHKTEARTFVDRSRERRQGRDSDRQQGRERVGQQVRDRNGQQGWDTDRRQGRDRDRRQGRDTDRQQGRDRERRQGQDRERRQGQDRARRTAFSDREAFVPAVLPPQLPPSMPLILPPAYAYERPVDTNYFRREAELERRERRLLDLELNRREEIAYRDPYGFRDPQPAYEQLPVSYHEPTYTRAPPPAHEPPLSYHDPLYTRAIPSAPEPLSYNEQLYTRAPPPAYPPLYRY